MGRELGKAGDREIGRLEVGVEVGGLAGGYFAMPPQGTPACRQWRRRGAHAANAQEPLTPPPLRDELERRIDAVAALDHQAHAQRLALAAHFVTLHHLTRRVVAGY